MTPLPPPLPALIGLPAWPTGKHPLPWILEQAAHEWCWVCGADPDTGCDVHPGCHLARLFRARDARRISATDVYYPIPWDALSGQVLLWGATIIPGPEATS